MFSINICSDNKINSTLLFLLNTLVIISIILLGCLCCACMRHYICSVIVSSASTKTAFLFKPMVLLIPANIWVKLDYPFYFLFIYLFLYYFVCYFLQVCTLKK